MRLNDSAESHDSVTNATISRIRNGKHIIIDWETNLLHVMRREYLETDKCEFTLGKFVDFKLSAAFCFLQKCL